MKGKNNEDSYATSSFYVDKKRKIPSALAVISDGIGGHRAGEVASDIAVDIIHKKIAESDASQPVNILQDAMIQASEAIRRQAEADPAQKGMGATCVCAWVIGDRLYAASVGDSRLYLIREHTIRKLSIDHTWVQEAIDAGAITRDQARSHPNAHVIRRYLGSPQPAIPDLRLRLRQEDTDTQAEDNQGMPLLPGDVLLLCSDGLTDLVDDQEILDEIEENGLEVALQNLENLANERGGHDNITIIGMQVPPAGNLPSSADTIEITKPVGLNTASLEATRMIKKKELEVPPKAAVKSRRYQLITCLSIAGLVILILGGFGGYAWINGLMTRPTVTSTPQTGTPSLTGTYASPTVTVTFVTMTVTATVMPAGTTPFTPPATLTLFPTNTILPPTSTPPNPFIH